MLRLVGMETGGSEVGIELDTRPSYSLSFFEATPFHVHKVIQKKKTGIIENPL